MINLSYIEEIKKLGFTEYEAKCYLALFEKDSLTVPELAKISGIPKSNAYQTMESLLTKGLCVVIPGETKKYSASDPQFVREKLFESLRNSMKTVDGMINNLDSLYRQNRGNNKPLEYIEVYKNPNHIHRKFIELYSKAQKEFIGFSRPPYSSETEEQMEEQCKIQFEATERKVVQRAIIQMPPADQAAEFIARIRTTERDIKDASKYHELRIIDELPVKMHVFDEKVCFFALEDPIKSKTSLTMVVIEHEAIAKSFKSLFESFWEKARNYLIIDNKKHYLYPKNEKGHK